MLGAGAPRSQGPAGMCALGRPWVLLLTYLLTTLDLTSLFMQFSVLPYLSRRLGLDSAAFGYLQTTFGVLQLLGGPVFGRFADQHGARAAFAVSFLGSCALYLLLAAACSPALPGAALLFASRLPAPLMHMLPAAQMVIVDLTAPEERPAALGRLGLCFGVGIILGSVLGGTLSDTCGIQCPALVALAANLLGAILSFACVPASTKGASAHAQAASPGAPQAGVFDLRAIYRLLLQPGVLPVFLVKVISGFPSGLFMIMFSIICMDFFQLDATHAGYLMSFSGALLMVIQGLVIGRLSRRFSEAALLRASVLGFIAVGLAMALMSTVFHFCLLMPGLVFSMCALNVVTDSMLTKAVSASDTAADPHPGARPGRPPVPQLWRLHLRPRAVCRQPPRPLGSLPTAYVPEDAQSPVTSATGHRLTINSLRTSSGLISADQEFGAWEELRPTALILWGEPGG
ncbi:solute carrier family 22 member 18 isoform 3-T3 [Molossus nigricans]